VRSEPVVRSEGGEDVSNFKALLRQVNSKVHFPPIGAFQAQPPELN
jgi:hypothetical protein